MITTLVMCTCGTWISVAGDTLEEVVVDMYFYCYGINNLDLTSLALLLYSHCNVQACIPSLVQLVATQCA